VTEYRSAPIEDVGHNLILKEDAVREVWAAYSVSDHLAKKAFVADVMLFDRLVIPVPADDDHDRWEKMGWNEKRQARLLAILGDRALPIVWDAQLRAKWRSRWDAAKSLGIETSREAMRMTPTVLLEKIPPQVTGVVAVAAFDSPEDLRKGLLLRVNPLAANPLPVPNYAPGQLAAVIGRECLVPNNPDRNEEDLLKEGVDLSGDTGFRRKRAAYWRWQREFLLDATILNNEALAEAVDEMKDLIEEEKSEARRSKIKLGFSFAFAVGAVATGIFTGPLAPVAVTSAFLSVGAWVIDHGGDIFGGVGTTTRPAALCLSAQRDFGWSD
jgi:hypothetical protein